MNRLKRVLAIGLILILGVALSCAAQEEPHGPQLVRALTQEGWSQAQADEMVRAMNRYGWDIAPKADPQVVAYAMGVMLQMQHQYTVKEMAQYAWGVTVAGGELDALGYGNREIAAACASSLRTMLQTKTTTQSQNQAADQELTQRIRIAARLRMLDGEHLELREQTRTQTQAGPGEPGSAPGHGPGPGPGGPGNKPE